MDPNAIVIFLKGFYLPRQIRCIPEQQVIQIFSTDGANRSFDEGMGHWYKGSSFDLLDAQNSQICLPLMEPKHGVIIGAKPLG